MATFAWSFYAQARPADENFVYSPYSIAIASAMLSAGAAGRTLAQLQSALSFSQAGPALHQSQSALALLLQSRNHLDSQEREAQLLRISNDLWIHRGIRPKPAFLDALARHYGSSAHLTAFDEKPNESRDAINQKVCNDTRGLIPDLLPEDSINADVRLVLTNALYFRARWESAFAKSETQPRPFAKLSGNAIQVPTMQRKLNARYVEGNGYFAVSLPYSGRELEMVLVVPDSRSFPSFAQSMSAPRIAAITAKLRPQFLDLALPKFQIETSLPLKSELTRAGMVDAFKPRIAKFPLIDPNLYVSEALHKARLIVDEEGTEAAAATAYISTGGSARREPTPIEVKIDRPFVFFLRDTSGAVLFVGQVLDPR